MASDKWLRSLATVVLLTSVVTEVSALLKFLVSDAVMSFVDNEVIAVRTQLRGPVMSSK